MESFEHNLIKGRIAEMIFETMFQETGKFTVLRFGYEAALPSLAQYRNIARKQEVVDQVSQNPDFVLVTENKTGVYFVEVKYRAYPDKKDLLQIATALKNRWEISYLFVISKDGFFFSPVHTVVNKGGVIDKLSPRWISIKLQEKYLGFVNEFLSNHTD